MGRCFVWEKWLIRFADLFPLMTWELRAHARALYLRLPGYQGDVTCGPFKKDEALKNCIEVVEEMMALGLKTVVDATPTTAA